MSDISRKKFIKNIVAGTAGVIGVSSLPGLSTTSFAKPNGEKLGVALVGLGNYATHQLAPALQQTTQCELTGIVTGTPAKAKVWAEKYGLADRNIYNYGDMGDMANNPDIDIVYIVLPNVMHADYAVKAAEAGKHVISEKPFTTNVKDARRVIDACNKNNRKLSIGYRLHFEPYNNEMMRLGQQQVYGKVNKMEAGFGFAIGNPYQWRLDKFMAGGGSLMDLGIYCLQSVIYTKGKLPEYVEAEIHPTDDPKFHEVESRIEWQFHFDDGSEAHCRSSYEASPVFSYLRVNAENGDFGLDPAFNYGGLQGHTPKGNLHLEDVYQQARQMDDFARRIKQDLDTPVPGEMGLRDVAILQDIYSAAETGQAIKIDPVYDIVDHPRKS